MTRLMSPLYPAPLLVERERELGVLRVHLDAARGGQGSLVLIGGEAGIGKTALAEAVCREAAERGARVLVGRCYDLTETPPYGPWVELFGRYERRDGDPPLPDAFAIRGTVGAVFSQAALFQQILDCFATLASRCPVVLLLDDAHWMDAASRDLLRVFGRSLASHAILVLVTYRADEITPNHPFNPLLPILVREASAARIGLQPLGTDAVRLLLTERYALSDVDTDRLVGYVQARAEGNPFYLSEILRSLEEAATLSEDNDGWHLGDTERTRIPALLRQVIEARLARFDVESQRLLTIAAVIGYEVPLALWASVGGRDEQAVLRVAERALAARLLAESADGDRVQFAHALVREALYERIPAIHRRRVHARVGEALMAPRAPDPDAVAYHFQRAGDDRAIAWLIQAGERAQRGYAWITAADRFDVALTLMEARGADAGERGWVLLRLALLHRYREYRRALSYAEQAGRAATEAGDSLLAAYARFTEGFLLCYSREWQRGVASMEEGVAALDARFPADADTRRRLQAMGLTTDPDNHRGTLAFWLAVLGKYERARTLGEAVATRDPTIESAGSLDCGIAANAFRALGNVYTALGQPDMARHAYRRGREAYRAIGDHFEVLNTARYELRDLTLPYRADDLAERRRLADEISESHAKMLGATFRYPPGPDLVPLLFLEGRWRDLAAQLRMAVNVGWPATWGGWMLGVLAREQGDTDQAWEQVRAVVPDGPATSPEWRRFLECAPVVRLAVLLALDAGDLATARQWLETHDRWLDSNGAVLGRSEGQSLWSQYYQQTGDAQRAREHAERALAEATVPRQPLALLAAHRLLGELDTVAGRFAAADGHLQESLALAAACAAPYERARTLLTLTELRAAEKKTAEARAACEEARAICTPLGARPALARLDALVARLAATPAERYPAGLTGREVEVLRLVAAGYTNRQIADALSLTEKTVKNHMTHILSKIDAGNRAAAVGFALRHGLA